jgi:hypothetical protein
MFLNLSVTLYSCNNHAKLNQHVLASKSGLNKTMPPRYSKSTLAAPGYAVFGCQSYIN